MDTLQNRLTDPLFLGFVGLILTGLFLPRIKLLFPKLKQIFLSLLSSKKTTRSDNKPSLFDPLLVSQNLSVFFAHAGDEEGTMLSVAISRHLYEETEKQLLKLCADCEKEDKSAGGNSDE